jgi:methyl-accepting chemotaxis protein
MGDRRLAAAMRIGRVPVLLALGGIAALAGGLHFANAIHSYLAAAPTELVGLGVAAIMAFAMTAGTAYVRLLQQKQHATAALDNMSQGLAMFDATGTLVLSNKRFSAMYNLPAGWLRPGMTIRALLEQRIKSGQFRGDPAARSAELMARMRAGKVIKEMREVADGRCFSITNWPAAGGGWVSTHDDVTDQRREEQERTRLSALEQRRITIERAVETFRTRSEGALRLVADNGEALRKTAEGLFAASNKTSQRADGAVQSSNDASTNVATAASAAEELFSSFAGLSQLLAQTHGLVEQAVDEAGVTNNQMDELARAAQKIGDVVELIQDIAGQTNLLALNATIEAARAGEAGRGFAVVASEVKSLAVQTGKATEEVTQLIAAVQGSAAKAVEAIRRIATRMQNISGLAAGATAAVREQDAATDTIKQNVASAAAGTRETVSVLEVVAGSATETRASAETVLTASTAVATAAKALRADVEEFLRAVAA